MAPNAPSDVVFAALRKTAAALQGVKRNPVVIGDVAHQAWGTRSVPAGVELLIPAGAEHRDAIFGAARGEGLQQAPGQPLVAGPDGATLRMRYADPKSGAAAPVEMIEAATPFLRQVYARAQPGLIQLQLPVATCEDLILLRAGSDRPADRAILVDLLRCTAGRMDAQYLRTEAEKAGVFDRIKGAWQEAKQQG